MITVSEIIQLFSFVFVICIAVTTHECGHAFVAKFFGDNTAEKAGRLSMNPLKHADPMGSIFLPAILYLMQAPLLFGWARPVPVDSRNFKKERQGLFFVAAAGPFMNIFLAWFSALLLYMNPRAATLGNEVLMMMIHVNCTLAAFNLLPLPPLDGGNMIAALLPVSYAEKYRRLENYTFFILIGVMLIPSLLRLPNPLFMVILPLRQSILTLISFLSGHSF